MDILLIHGYNVTSTKTYGVLPQRLKALGHKVKDVYLAKYVTLDDDIRMTDIIKAFQAALEDIYGKNLGDKEFACVTHSTGGLVVRAWIDAYYGGNMKALPLTHLIMLAPPNNGSRLAAIGKSKLSRFRAILGIEPGLLILDALELGSDYAWQVNSSWMEKKLHAAAGFYPFVITGQWIDKKIWDVLVPATYERGSDGVVRAAAANLNMQKYTMAPGVKPKRQAIEGAAFLITPKASHSGEEYGIMAGVPAKGDHPTLTAITDALAVHNKPSYSKLFKKWAESTETLQRQDTYYDGSRLDRYCQVVFRVTDTLGNRLDDFAIELLDATGRGDQMPSGFNANQHKNTKNPEYFTFFLNYDQISKLKGGKLGFRINAATGSPLVAYAVEQFLVEENDVTKILQPNQTTLVDIVMRRRLNKEMFRLTKNFGYQKIVIKPSEEWID